MINTFHSSYNPPPVPPRAGYKKAQPSGNTPLVKFLSVMLLLLMTLTFGGFLYLFQKVNGELQWVYQEDTATLKKLQQCVNGNRAQECQILIEKVNTVMGKVSQENGTFSKFTGGPSRNGPAAHMVFLSEHNEKYKESEALRSNSLLWDKERSLLQGVQITVKRDRLTIQTPGVYFIYSQVTFSRRATKNPLKQTINRSGPKNDNKELLKSFCTLHENTEEMCTASSAGVFRLEKDQQVYVTVTDRSLVNKKYCWFGLFKL